MSGELWSLDALLAATGGRAHGRMPAGVNGLSIDTRTLKRGEAFFAIRGDRFDGHDFLTAAGTAGAGLLVVAEQRLPALGKVQTPFVVVDDVLAALGRLAVAARARSGARIVAVTGSVGKTTTKDALRHILAPSGAVHASAASFNNHWGVPLSLARLPADARFAVFEIGMNHPNEIRPLVKLARPHAAIVTLIAPAHLGHFRDLDEIAAAKGEIFEGLGADGTAIINADDPFGPALAAMATAAGVTDVKTFGSGPEADFRLAGFEPTETGARVDLRLGGRELQFDIGSSGRHVAENLTAAFGVASLFGADLDAAAGAAASWFPGKGRGERRRIAIPGGGSAELLDESYNANPASMRAAIAVLGARPVGTSGRRIAVLGDMLELGRHAPAMHAALAELLEAAGVDKVFLIGVEMKALDDVLAGRLDCEWHATRGELQARLLAQVRAGDVLMVKASNGIGLSALVERLTAAQETAGPAPQPER